MRLEGNLDSFASNSVTVEQLLVVIMHSPPLYILIRVYYDSEQMASGSNAGLQWAAMNFQRCQFQTSYGQSAGIYVQGNGSLKNSFDKA